MSSCAVAGYQRKESSTSPSTAPLEEGVDCNEFTPQPSLLISGKGEDNKNERTIEQK